MAESIAKFSDKTLQTVPNPEITNFSLNTKIKHCY